MKSKVITMLLAAAFTVTASSTFVSCKDYESDDYQELEFKMNNLDTDFQKRVTDLNDQIAQLTTKLNSIKSCTCKDPSATINVLKNRVDSILDTTDPNSINSQVASLIKEVEALKNKKDDTSWKDRLTKVENTLTAIQGKYKTDSTAFANGINKAVSDLAKLDTREAANHTADSTAIEALKTRVAALEGVKDDTTWRAEIRNLKTQLETMQATDANLKKLIDIINDTTIPRLKTYFEGKVAEANAAAAAAQTAANNAKTAADKAQADATKALADAKAAKEHADSLYDKADKAIKNVAKDVADLKDMTVDMLTGLITEVIVQSTYSPAVGELALPLDIKANALVTYYGNNEQGAFQFPTADSRYFSKKSDADIVTAADLSGAKKVEIPAGEFVDGDGAEGNAGTLYVTINPNTVSPEGVQFALQNSLGQESPIKVGEAKPSNKLLTWGYTRAGNNFYEIPVTITKDNLEPTKITLAGAQVREEVQKLLKNRTNTKQTLKNLAKKMVKFVYMNMNGRAERLALATKYQVKAKKGTDSLMTPPMTNVTEMNILAGSIRPVGFGALDEVHMITVPGLEKAEAMISKFINQTKIGKIKFDANVGTIDSIATFDNLSRDGEHYYLTVTYTYTDNGVEKTGTAKVNIDDQIDDILAIVNDDYTDINKSITSFNKNLPYINELIAELQTGFDIDSQLAGTKADLINRINNFLNRQNERLAYWFNRSVAAALKPCMLFVANDGVHRLTGSVNGVTVRGASQIVLVPTSYTYELFAPAYKKYVKVSDASTGAALVNKVLPGDARQLVVSGLQAGHKYTVFYEAVDYTGKVVARKYLLNVE